jgi:L-threonylcarbamoyladenylate synthase
MNTTILATAQTAALTTALAYLAADEAIVAPTDTVYGIMCRFDRPNAIDKLYEIKGRPPEKAIPVLIGDATQLPQLTPEPIAPLAQALAAHFWPGPLTIVLPARPTLPASLTARQPTVGVRLPNHDWLRTLIRQSGPLAATSANRSGEPEAHTVAEIVTQLGGRVKLVIADAQLEQRHHTASLPSTVVAIEAEQAVRILRPGPISQQVQHFLQEHWAIHANRH